MKIVEAKFELSSQELGNKFEEYKNECEQEYFNTLTEVSKEFQRSLTNLQKELNEIELQIIEKEKELENQKAIAAAAIEANKRQLEESSKQNYYRIQINALDLEEVDKLRSIAPMFRNREPLDKVIWKTYYEKPTADLIARVIGTGTKIGIYKITDIETGMVYIG